MLVDGYSTEYPGADPEYDRKDKVATFDERKKVYLEIVSGMLSATTLR